jgi:hypothetical protein
MKRTTFMIKLFLFGFLILSGAVCDQNCFCKNREKGFSLLDLQIDFLDKKGMNALKVVLDDIVSNFNSVATLTRKSETRLPKIAFTGQGTVPRYVFSVKANADSQGAKDGVSVQTDPATKKALFFQKEKETKRAYLIGDKRFFVYFHPYQGENRINWNVIWTTQERLLDPKNEKLAKLKGNLNKMKKFVLKKDYAAGPKNFSLKFSNELPLTHRYSFSHHTASQFEFDVCVNFQIFLNKMLRKHFGLLNQLHPLTGVPIDSLNYFLTDNKGKCKQGARKRHVWTPEKIMKLDKKKLISKLKPILLKNRKETPRLINDATVLYKKMLITQKALKKADASGKKNTNKLFQKIKHKIGKNKKGKSVSRGKRTDGLKDHRSPHKNDYSERGQPVKKGEKAKSKGRPRERSVDTRIPKPHFQVNLENLKLELGKRKKPSVFGLEIPNMKAKDDTHFVQKKIGPLLIVDYAETPAPKKDHPQVPKRAVTGKRDFGAFHGPSENGKDESTQTGFPLKVKKDFSANHGPSKQTRDQSTQVDFSKEEGQSMPRQSLGNQKPTKSIDVGTSGGPWNDNLKDVNEDLSTPYFPIVRFPKSKSVSKKLFKRYDEIEDETPSEKDSVVHTSSDSNPVEKPSLKKPPPSLSLRKFKSTGSYKFDFSQMAHKKPRPNFFMDPKQHSIKELPESDDESGPTPHVKVLPPANQQQPSQAFSESKFDEEDEVNYKSDSFAEGSSREENQPTPPKVQLIRKGGHEPQTEEEH